MEAVWSLVYHELGRGGLTERWQTRQSKNAFPFPSIFPPPLPTPVDPPVPFSGPAECPPDRPSAEVCDAEPGEGAREDAEEDAGAL